MEQKVLTKINLCMLTNPMITEGFGINVDDENNVVYIPDDKVVKYVATLPWNYVMYLVMFNCKKEYINICVWAKEDQYVKGCDSCKYLCKCNRKDCFKYVMYLDNFNLNMELISIEPFVKSTYDCSTDIIFIGDDRFEYDGVKFYTDKKTLLSSLKKLYNNNVYGHEKNCHACIEAIKLKNEYMNFTYSYDKCKYCVFNYARNGDVIRNAYYCIDLFDIFIGVENTSLFKGSHLIRNFLGKVIKEMEE